MELFGGHTVFFGIWACGVVLTPLAIICGTVDAVLGMEVKGTVPRLALYEATCPITVGQSIRQKFATVMEVALATLAVFATAAVVVIETFLGGLVSDFFVLASENRTIALMQVAGCLLAVAAAGATVCATLTLLLMGFAYAGSWVKGHPGVVCVGGCAVFVSAALPVAQEIFSWNIGGLIAAVQVAWGAFLVIATLGSLRYATRARLFSGLWSPSLAGAWCFLVIAVVAMALFSGANTEDLSIYNIILLVGVACVPLGGIAWAPMSLSALRHQ
jgi:hypothetical protein